MARKRIQAVEEVQIQLMEVDHPITKKFKALRRKLESEMDAKNDAADKAKVTRHAILTLVREAGFKADIDGVIRIEIDGGIVEISQGESKLTFKEKPKGPKADGKGEGAGEAGDEGDATD